MALQVYIAMLQHEDRDEPGHYTFVGPFPDDGEWTEASKWGATHFHGVDDWQLVSLNPENLDIMTVEEADQAFPYNDPD